jgi:hypothetical protein
MATKVHPCPEFASDDFVAASIIAQQVVSTLVAVRIDLFV